MAVARLIAATAGVALLVGGCSSGASPTGAGTAGSDDPPPVVRTGRAPNTPFDVTSLEFGIHSYTSKPEVPTGTIRISCGPTWSAMEPTKGGYDWSRMDAAIARAEAWGYSDILFSICGTPSWAGVPVTGKDVAVFGPGTAQPPADLADWETFVRALAERYRGRIDGYEAWNEPSSPQFFTGSPTLMAQMTEIASRTIHEADPDAYVLSASFQTHSPQYYDRFSVPYLRQLAALQWPVDGIAAHFYPDTGGTPQDRVKLIETVQRQLTSLDAPQDLPLWDTEVNYQVGLPGGKPDGRITGDQAAAWVTQTFLDSWRTGVRRTYWYLWTSDYYDFPGIQMRHDDAATRALNVLGFWMAGAGFQGCKTEHGAVVCEFSHADGPFTVAWAPGGKATLPMQGTHAVCPVSGLTCQDKSGPVPLTQVPVRID